MDQELRRYLLVHYYDLKRHCRIGCDGDIVAGLVALTSTLFDRSPEILRHELGRILKDTKDPIEYLRALQESFQPQSE